jgi:anti-sigma-K factor RskA
MNPAGPRPERRAYSYLALAATFLLAVALGALWLKARDENERLATDLVRARSETVRLTRRWESERKESAWIHDPRVQIAMMKGLAGSESAKARLVWHPEKKRGVLFVDGLPPLPLEKSYELWAFVGDTPRRAGVFDAKAGETNVISLADLGPAADKPTKFAVSVEPKGGVAAPTGTVVLAGENL